MAGHPEDTPPDTGLPWRAIGWSAAVGLLLLPLIAMQFTSEVRWTIGDFIGWLNSADPESRAMPRPTRVSRYLALGLVVLGVMLMIMKIIADSEPGAIPLLLILVGSAGYLLARKGQSSQD